MTFAKLRAKCGFLAVAACATLLWAGPVLAAPTAQQKCNAARVRARKKYVLCVENVVAKVVGGVNVSSHNALLANCRHRYFSNWTKFQASAYTGSTCIGNRFTDNGDQTVTDNLSGLTWEKKDNAGGVHDKDNTYSWSTSAPYKNGDGSAFQSFLVSTNQNTFGGTNDWRLPTLAELQTILLDFQCTAGACDCGTYPCIDPAFDTSNSQSNYYWSATSRVGYSYTDDAWGVLFSQGYVYSTHKTTNGYVRAVRGGF